VQFDVAAAELVAALLQEQCDTLLHLQPARGEGAGLDREEADLDRPGLGNRCGNFECLERYASGSALWQSLKESRKDPSLQESKIPEQDGNYMDVVLAAERGNPTACNLYTRTKVIANRWATC
jgi:hypothetical protein